MPTTKLAAAHHRVHAILFDRSRWTTKVARHWLTKNHHTLGELDESDPSHWKFVQAHARHFKGKKLVHVPHSDGIVIIEVAEGSSAPKRRKKASKKATRKKVTKKRTTKRKSSKAAPKKAAAKKRSKKATTKKRAKKATRRKKATKKRSMTASKEPTTKKATKKRAKKATAKKRSKKAATKK
jgi:hypothetical protein